MKNWLKSWSSKDVLVKSLYAKIYVNRTKNISTISFYINFHLRNKKHSVEEEGVAHHDEVSLSDCSVYFRASLSSHICVRTPLFMFPHYPYLLARVSKCNFFKIGFSKEIYRNKIFQNAFITDSFKILEQPWQVLFVDKQVFYIHLFISV